MVVLEGVWARKGGRVMHPVAAFDLIASLACLAALFFLIAIGGRFYGERAFLGFKAMNVFFFGMGLAIWAIWARLESKSG